CVFSFSSCVYDFIVFFFQAEDGIRDRNVTGVQTCALPIFRRTSPCPPPWREERPPSPSCGMCRARPGRRRRPPEMRRFPFRMCPSPTARVGKECGARGERAHEKKEKQERGGRCEGRREGTG